MSLIIKFVCSKCKRSAIDEYKKTHKIKWSQINLDELKDFDKNSIIREASEVMLTKGIEKIESFDGLDEWILTCSTCGTKNWFSRGIGSI